MGSIRARKENGLLFFDFRYQSARCREQTLLKDNAQNRKVMKKVLAQIEEDIEQGMFDYKKYFPNSTFVSLIESACFSTLRKLIVFVQELSACKLTFLQSWNRFSLETNRSFPAFQHILAINNSNI